MTETFGLRLSARQQEALQRSIRLFQRNKLLRNGIGKSYSLISLSSYSFLFLFEELKEREYDGLTSKLLLAYIKEGNNRLALNERIQRSGLTIIIVSSFMPGVRKWVSWLLIILSFFEEACVGLWLSLYGPTLHTLLLKKREDNKVRKQKINIYYKIPFLYYENLLF